MIYKTENRELQQRHLARQILRYVCFMTCAALRRSKLTTSAWEAHLVWDSKPVTIIIIIIIGQQLLVQGVCMIVTSEVTHDQDHVRRHKPLTILVQHIVLKASMPQLPPNRQYHLASPQLFGEHYHMCFDEWLAS